ncbi:hypothetical protein [Terasakiella pusilla]|uniref:hypothetical protein n=1 Tax=Terasakiella pusilla TaxID=64973 RepID=UPI003AA9D12C
MDNLEKAMRAANDTQVKDTAIFAQDEVTAQEFSDMMRRLGHAGLPCFAGGCEAALRWSSQNRAQVLVVDIDGEPAPLRSLATMMEHCDPTCRIVVVGSVDDVDFYRALLQSGVFDYLKKPVQMDLLSSTLERARGDDDHDFARIGRTVAVVGTAGGMGTSTLVAALGTVLSSVRRVPAAIVDFDRRKSEQGLLLGVSGDAGLETTLTSQETDLRLLQRSMIDVNSRLKLLSQEKTSDYGDVDSDRLLNLGATLCQLFKQVIWDIPAGLPHGAINILHHAEVRVLLTDLTIQGARSTQRLLAEIGDETEGQQLLLVCNPTHGEHGSISQAQFEDYINRPLNLTLPYVGQKLSESLLQGPLDVSCDPAFYQQVMNLADLVRGSRLETVEKQRFSKLPEVIRRWLPNKEAVA